MLQSSLIHDSLVLVSAKLSLRSGQLLVSPLKALELDTGKGWRCSGPFAQLGEEPRGSPTSVAPKMLQRDPCFLLRGRGVMLTEQVLFLALGGRTEGALLPPVWGCLCFWSCWVAYRFSRRPRSALLDRTEKMGSQNSPWHGCRRHSWAPVPPQLALDAGAQGTLLVHSPPAAPRASIC